MRSRQGSASSRDLERSVYGTVQSTTWLTPAMVRIVLGGDGLASFEPPLETDAYVNVAIPPAHANYTAPFDLDRVHTEQSDELQPHRRRYTVRRFNASDGELTLDVVVHEGGPGGMWAAGAAPGDALVLTGPGGGYRPAPTADHHLLAGDESALPAIGASLEVLPPGARGTAFVVVDGPDHELDLAHPPGVEVRWLHRTGNEQADERLLADAVSALPNLPLRVHAFVHGEAGEVRAVRRHLLTERGLTRAELSCSPYWRRHLADEAWRQAKPAWSAEVERDVA
jgi:NADPH-dependent ferric siderophore reductase